MAALVFNKVFNIQHRLFNIFHISHLSLLKTGNFKHRLQQEKKPPVS